MERPHEVLVQTVGERDNTIQYNKTVALVNDVQSGLGQVQALRAARGREEVAGVDVSSCTRHKLGQPHARVLE